MSNIAVRSTLLTPRNLTEAMEYAKLIASSAIIPKSYQGKPSDIIVAVQMGAELGLQPIQALQSIVVINGKPSVYGDSAIALVQAHQSFENIKEWFDEKTNTAFCSVKRKNQSEHTVSFSVEDAKKAELWGKSGPWSQYPKRMMQMRARGFALRDKFADALKGLITIEEAQDYPVEGVKVDVTPRAQVLSSKLDDLIVNSDENVVNIKETDTSECANKLSELVLTYNIPAETVKKWCDKAGVESIYELDEEKTLACIEHINKQYVSNIYDINKQYVSNMEYKHDNF